MDPDQCLKELLELNEKVGDFVDTYGSSVELDSEATTDEINEFLANVNDMCDHVASLNGWMKRGGFIPKDWSTGRNTSTGEADSSTSKG